MVTFNPIVNLDVLINLFVLLFTFGGISWRMATSFSTFEGIVKSIGDRIVSVEIHIDKITDILITLGKQEVRLDALDRRIDEIQTFLRAKTN